MSDYMLLEKNNLRKGLLEFIKKLGDKNNKEEKNISINDIEELNKLIELNKDNELNEIVSYLEGGFHDYDKDAFDKAVDNIYRCTTVYSVELYIRKNVIPDILNMDIFKEFDINKDNLIKVMSAIVKNKLGSDEERERIIFHLRNIDAYKIKDDDIKFKIEEKAIQAASESYFDFAIKKKLEIERRNPNDIIELVNDYNIIYINDRIRKQNNNDLFIPIYLCLLILITDKKIIEYYKMYKGDSIKWNPFYNRIKQENGIDNLSSYLECFTSTLELEIYKTKDLYAINELQQILESIETIIKLLEEAKKNNRKVTIEDIDFTYEYLQNKGLYNDKKKQKKLVNYIDIL